MQQYFVKGNLSLHQEILLNQEQSHHIQHVLRMKDMDVIRVANDDQDVFYAQVNMRGKKVVAVLTKQLEKTIKPLHITLAQALIKGEKWDYLIQKACELGVDSIQPILSKRCVVKVNEDKLDKKLQRWNKIAQEACEQCKRPELVQVLPPIALSNLSMRSDELRIIAYEQANQVGITLKDLVQAYPNCKSIVCVIGPEGGFEVGEVELLMKHGYHCVSLGTRILRAETAALSIINSLTFTYDC